MIPRELNVNLRGVRVSGVRVSRFLPLERELEPERERKIGGCPYFQKNN